jgi:ferredoxin
MRIEYDRAICNGWFQCMQEWSEFEMNIEEGKADLDGAESRSNNTFVREVPEEAEAAARRAAESCPVDAIELYNDGEKVGPED